MTEDSPSSEASRLADKLSERNRDVLDSLASEPTTWTVEQIASDTGRNVASVRLALTFLRTARLARCVQQDHSKGRGRAWVATDAGKACVGVPVTPLDHIEQAILEDLKRGPTTWRRLVVYLRGVADAHTLRDAADSLFKRRLADKKAALASDGGVVWSLSFYGKKILETT